MDTIFNAGINQVQSKTAGCGQKAAGCHNFALVLKDQSAGHFDESMHCCHGVSKSLENAVYLLFCFPYFGFCMHKGES